MLAWPIDHANVVYFALGLVVLGLLVSWWLNRRVRTLVYVLAVVALIVLFWLLTLVVVTDRKQIEANLWAMERAVRENKPAELAKHLAKDFSFAGMRRDELAKAATRSADEYDVEAIKLWEFDWKSVDENKAEVWFRCVAHARDAAPFLAICRATFTKEDAQWKLQRVSFHKPVADTHEEIPIPLR
jgi:hypothetical protein